MTNTNQETNLWTRSEDEWHRKIRNYVRGCLASIDLPLTLEGVEKFFKHYNSPTNGENESRYTAELLADLKRDFSAEDLRQEMSEIAGRVSDYKWNKLDKYRNWDYQDYKGDEGWRKDILSQFWTTAQTQEKEQPNHRGRADNIQWVPSEASTSKSQDDLTEKKTFYDDGSIRAIYSEDKEGKIQGKATVFDEDPHGIRAIYTYKDGLRNGPYTWFDHGRAETGTYEDGAAEGPYKITDIATQRVEEEGQRACGKKSGIVRRYWENNQLASETAYTDDTKDGQSTSYFPNGWVATRGEYDMDTPIGLHERFSGENGKVMSKEWYDKSGSGKRTGYEFYWANGNLKEKYTAGVGYTYGTEDGEVYGDEAAEYLRELEKQRAKEEVESKTGYSAEALAGVGKEVLKAKDGADKKDLRQVSESTTNTSSTAVKDMLSKMADSKVAEDIVKAGLGSEHLSTSAGGLETAAKDMEKTLEASETGKRSMIESLRESSTPIAQSKGKTKSATKDLSPELLKKAAKKTIAD